MLKGRISILILTFILFNQVVQAQEEYPARDTIIKGNGDRIVCFVKTFENDRIQYVTGGRFLTTTYTQRLSKIIFSDGTFHDIQPVLKINGEQDWERVKVVSDRGKVKNLIENGIIDVQKQGALFGKQEKVRTALIDQIKKEAAKMGAHIVLIVDSDNNSGGIEWDGDKIISIRPGAKITAVSFGF
jgi:hypothetical protein